MLPDIMGFSDSKRKLLDKYLKGELRQISSAPAAIRQARNVPPPLSLAQHQVWIRSQLTAGMPPLYNESITVYRNRPISPAVLQRSLNEVIRRHEAWRTTFDMDGTQPVQIIHSAPAEVLIRIADVSGLPEAEREPAALQLGTEEARLGFDLKHGPLVRATLVTLTDQDHRLFLTMHQMIVDGITVYDIFPAELALLYEAFSSGSPSPLPDLPVQFADFALWQRHWLQGEAQENQVSYWRKQLAGNLPVLQWPRDRQRPPSQTYRGAIQPFTMPARLTERLRELSRQEGISLFATLLAAFSTLLHCYTGQHDIVVGTLAPTGRKRSEFQRLLGYFLNPVPLRTDLSGNPTVRALLRQSQEVTVRALSHDDVPLEYLADELRLTLDASRHPFFQVVISLAPSVPDLPRGWAMTPMDVESGGARWDLYLELNDRADGLIGRAQYNPDLFARTTIIRVTEHLQSVLQSFVSDPHSRLSESGEYISADTA